MQAGSHGESGAHGHPLGRSERGRALMALVIENTHLFFHLRTVGARFGAVTPWGGSTFGLLGTLHRHGPCTVPQAARMRPVARQHIQKLANEMARDGLIEFTDNPAHKRSKLMRLTREGEETYAELVGHMEDMAEQFAVDLDPDELRRAAKVLGEVRAKLEES